MNTPHLPDLAQLKGRFSLAQTATALGIVGWPDGPALIKSPLRDDRRPSLSIYQGRDGLLRWKDHANGSGGDQIDLIATYRNVSIKDAIELFRTFAN